MTTPQITVSPLATPYHDGDWHDAPLKYTVQGPNTEVQNFSTKRDAMKYATLRRRSASFSEAGRRFAQWYSNS